MRNERKGEYILIRKQVLSRDSWTYGDYRQFIAERDDGSLQPCRSSKIPFHLTMFGFVLLMIVGMIFLNFTLGDRIVNWGNAYIMTFIGFVSFGVGLGLEIGDYRLMKATGWRSYDGKRRHYFEEQPMDGQLGGQRGNYDNL